MKLGSSTRSGRLVILLAVLAACLSVPTLAAAAVKVPPGATEGDQYFEEVPNGGGSGSVNKGGEGGAGGAGAGGASVAATQELNKLGGEGRAAAALANDNAPPQVKLDKPVPPTQRSSSTEGEGGMGFWFPLLVGITAVAAIAYGLRRRVMPAQ